VTDAAELERLGLVAPPDEFAPLSSARSARDHVGGRTWPSYAKALDGASLNRAGNGPDRSRADYVWSMIAVSWGFGIEETARRLMEESSKAREEGRSYADLTVTNGYPGFHLGWVRMRRQSQPRLLRQPRPLHSS
jgi:hypothetical protein